MRKIPFYLPAAVWTAGVLFLSFWLRDWTLTTWYGWAVLMWLSGYLLSRGRGWGCIPGLIPAVQILSTNLTETAQTLDTSPIGWTFLVYFLACGFYVWKTGQRQSLSRPVLIAVGLLALGLCIIPSAAIFLPDWAAAAVGAAPLGVYGLYLLYSRIKKKKTFTETYGGKP